MVKGNIEKHQEQWHSHMKEVNEQHSKFGFTVRVNHDIGKEHLDSSEEEFEQKNVCLGDTGATSHLSMVHSGFKTTTKGKVKTCFAVDGDEVEVDQFGEWKGGTHNRKRVV